MRKTNSGQHETELNVAAFQTTEPKDERVGAALGIFSDLKKLEVTPETPIGATEILSTVVVRRPKNNEFVRVHTDPANTLITTLFEDKDEGEAYLVAPHIRPIMIAGVSVRMLALAVNQMGNAFIWPVPTDDTQSRRNAWNESAREAYHKAKTDWIKLVGDRGAGHYRLYRAEGQLPNPRWPEGRSFPELLSIAFRNRMVDTEDHPVIRAMRGLAV
jgi:hypothetical protein